MGGKNFIEETEASMLVILQELKEQEPQRAEVLRQQLQELVEELTAARMRVNDQSRQNMVLQKQADQHRKMMARINDLELQNHLFSTRASEDEGRLQELECQAVDEARLCWERCCMANEEVAGEWRLLQEARAVAEATVERGLWEEREVERMELELAELTTRIEELDKIHDATDKKAEENKILFDKLQRLRKGKSRWK